MAINYRSSLEEAEKTHALFHDYEGQMEDMDVKHIPVRADVSREADILAMFATVMQEMGPVDILINNAGFQIPGESTRSLSRPLTG